MEIVTIFNALMLQSLNFFYTVSGNYGIAIILLTMAINFALYPLTLQSLVQMSALQKIQPKMQEIQKKFKEDPSKMQKELLDLYKSEKVNPMGGCLPTILKIPFFIGLFVTLQSKEFTALIVQPNINSSLLWMSNLAAPDPTYIMPIAIGASTFWMQKTMPTAGGSEMQAQMQMMTYFMPILLTFMCLQFASGVQIYWLVSNVMAAAQQMYIHQKVISKK